MNLSTIRERIVIDLIRRAPKSWYASVVGWGAQRTLPPAMRAPLLRSFARRVGANLDEVELPLSRYPTVGAFFTRRLRDGARPMPVDTRAVIAPCDGRLAAIGTADEGRLIQAKGRDYSLTDLLADPQLSEILSGGPYFTIYLSPADYHRVHTPIAAKLLGYRYLPGTLFPVNPLFVRHVDALLARNERVVFHLHSSSIGHIAVVMVAAVAVGNIEVVPTGVNTSTWRGGASAQNIALEPAVELRRGQELGIFHLGSTTIVIFEPNRVSLNALPIGTVTRLGHEVGRLNATNVERIPTTEAT